MPLHVAAFHGQAEVVRLLLQSGAEKDANLGWLRQSDGKMQFPQASPEGHTAFVKIWQRDGWKSKGLTGGYL